MRPTHRANDGRVFTWDDPPDTGHPGEDYNCRCAADPYIPGDTEFAFHEFTSDFPSGPVRWGNREFVWHYYFGDGRAVTLEEIGHLREIAEQYAYADGAQGSFRRLSGQISDAARENGAGELYVPFNNTYQFGDVAFSHGRGTVSGSFLGSVEYHDDMLRITGESSFEFSDDFADPLDMSFEPGGTPYHISGRWHANFSAEVTRDRRSSIYFDPRK